MHKPTCIAAAAACALLAAPALAQSTGEWDIGTIYATANSFCPVNTLEAQGQTLQVSNYQALFSLVGYTYGGDGQANFKLPDLRARVPTGYNASNPALASLPWGSAGGTEPVPITLTLAQMPAHNHTGTTASLANGTITASLNASTASPGVGNPAGASLGTFPNAIYAAGTPAGPAVMSTGSVTATLASTNVAVNIASAGGNAQIPMARNPYIAVRYCIVYQGIYPQHP